MKKNKLVSVLISFAMAFGISMLAIVLYYSISYWAYSFRLVNELNLKFYLTGILIAIVSGTMYFLKIFINTLGDAIKDLKNG